MSSIGKNYIYNLLYQVFILIIPLITIPYISRVLGSNGVGINAYTNSIIQYFILFGTIGVTIYGNRSIAYVRDNKDNLSSTFWSLFILKLITTGIVYAIFVIFVLNVNQYKTIFLIQSIYIISAAIDISWLFMGLEDFKKTVLRNVIVKTLGLVSIFLFIRTDSDLWKYVLILSTSEMLGQLTLWYYVPKIIKKIKINWKDVKKHFLPAVYLFIPQIAIQIYAVLNKTMLGIISNTNEVGYFDNADKIVKLVLAIVTAMGVVMLPRVAHTFARGDTEKVKEYLNKSLDFTSYLSIPMMFGLAGIANEFVPLYFGPNFIKTGPLICLISPIVVLIAWSNVLGMQYLMPVGKVRAFTISVTAGAVVNFAMNLILIRSFNSIGTAVATVIAELIVTAVQLAYVWKEVSFKQLFLSLWKYFVSGLMTFIFARVIGYIFHEGISTTLLQIVIGTSIYFVMLFLLRSEMNKTIFKKGFNIAKEVLKH